MADEMRQQFFMMDEGTEDFYDYKDWRLGDDEEGKAGEAAIDDVDLKKVIVVDSQPFFRNIIKTHLEAAECIVMGQFAEAAEACEFLSKEPVRFAVVDIDQTNGGNAKAVHIIAAAHPRTVFLVASARFSKEQLASGGRPPYYFLPKPVTRAIVTTTMKRAYDAELAKKPAPPAAKKK